MYTWIYMERGSSNKPPSSIFGSEERRTHISTFSVGITKKSPPLACAFRRQRCHRRKVDGGSGSGYNAIVTKSTMSLLLCHNTPNMNTL